MKKRFLFLCLLLVICSVAQAQRGIKVAYIDMEYILENVPEYNEATRQLESRTQKWKSEIETKMQNVEDMKQNLENERALLTKELIEERQEEIDYEEKDILNYQEEKFGPQGQFIVQKRQLVQPVQDQVFNAVQEIGEKRQYDFIFENSADALLLFSAQRHDISDQVLAIIQRSSRKLDMENRRDQKEKDDVAENEPYKSVEKAADDKEAAAEREAIRENRENEREELLNERQRKRDSIRDARQQEFEARRAKLLEERERKRDSLENLRNQQNNANNGPPGVPNDNK